MNANDTSPPNGEKVSAESFPQYCLGCETEWRLFGDLDDTERECPECGREVRSSRFFRWWIVENLDTTPQVEVEVPREVSAAIDELEPVAELERWELIEEIVMPQFEYEESRDERS